MGEYESMKLLNWKFTGHGTFY